MPENADGKSTTTTLRTARFAKKKEKKVEKNEWKKKLRNPVTELEQRSLQVDRSTKL